MDIGPRPRWLVALVYAGAIAAESLFGQGGTFAGTALVILIGLVYGLAIVSVLWFLERSKRRPRLLESRVVVVVSGLVAVAAIALESTVVQAHLVANGPNPPRAIVFQELLAAAGGVALWVAVGQWIVHFAILALSQALRAAGWSRVDGPGPSGSHAALVTPRAEPMPEPACSETRGAAGPAAIHTSTPYRTGRVAIIAVTSVALLAGVIVLARITAGTHAYTGHGFRVTVPSEMVAQPFVLDDGARGLLAVRWSAQRTISQPSGPVVATDTFEVDSMPMAGDSRDAEVQRRDTAHPELDCGVSNLRTNVAFPAGDAVVYTGWGSLLSSPGACSAQHYLFYRAGHLWDVSLTGVSTTQADDTVQTFGFAP